MSILKKVLRAVKKMFTASIRRPKKRRSKAAKPRRQRKPAARRSVLKPKPKAPKVKPAKAPKTPAQPKKPVVVKAKAVPAVVPKVKSVGILVGEVTHYFDRIKVCVIRIDRDHIKKGDRLLVKGPKSELIQNVTSMQIENEDVTQAKKGQLIGLKVAKPVSVKDEVYKTSSKG
jgi:hypothetical protein